MRRLPAWEFAFAPLLAVMLGSAIVLSGRHGVDLAAHLYRVDLFRQSGWTLWDSQWYGGHWTLNYSVIFPPIAASLGLAATAVLCAACASAVFDAIVVEHFGQTARLSSVVFGLVTVSQVAIGQLPFLLGEALGLAAYWAASRRRFDLAWTCAVAASLASPLAGAFVAVAAAALLLDQWPLSRGPLIGLLAAALAPIAALGLLFPGTGPMPFPALDCAVIVAILVVADRNLRGGLRTGVRVYLAAVVFCFVVPTPVGGDVTRLAESLGAPLAAATLWPERRRFLAVAIVPLGLLQFGAPVTTLVTSGSDPSTAASYYRGLLAFLERSDRPAGRIEVVPTRLHSEAAYVAPYLPIARGWERQLDIVDNPLFYAQRPPTPAAYRAWLLDNGVRFVAVPDSPLDYSATAEARLVRAGVDGLVPRWHDAHWRVFELAGAPGIVAGPASLVRLEGATALLDATGPGPIVVRVRYDAGWSIQGTRGCVTRAPGGGLLLATHPLGTFSVRVGLSGPPGC